MSGLDKRTHLDNTSFSTWDAEKSSGKLPCKTTLIFNLECFQTFGKLKFFLQRKLLNFCAFDQNRGVQKFKIEVSNSHVDFTQGTWKILMEEVLDDDSSKQDQCAVPRIGFQLPEFYQARFLRFYVLKHFGDGAALQYFKIE